MFDTSITKSGTALRPLSAGQLFDRAIRLYRHNFLTFIGIIAISQIPITVANILLSLLAPPPDTSAVTAEVFGDTPFTWFLQMSQAAGTSSVFGSFVVSLLSGALGLIGAAALTRRAVDAYFGQPGTILDGYRRLGGAWLSLLGAVFLTGIVMFLLSLWTFIPLIGWFTGPGLIFFYALVVLPFITPVIVVERKKGSDGLPRALELAQRRFWWFIGFMLLLGLFSQVIVTGPALLLGGVVSALVGEGVSATMSAIIFQTINLLLSLIYLPVQLTCVLLIYLDVRVRSEGLDLALKAADVANAEQALDPLAVIADAPYPNLSVFPRRTDLGQYFLFSLAVLGVYLGFVAVFAMIALLFSGL